ncbi:flagellar export chaperone FliS [Pseudalkalibacillus salsuginis]|uniref:flagellar export chaperone FliS n=1 Tax=Pseudalkalibacillus salsuginis TaxID=2910972 RepID=UPI001F24BD70|nr:flagellar export chaperone FliS [Pseudalkalibacillus salsuginis]MCF6410156.1 flagellar export chaperone FliS [Pseudalkalibacillus salsuginis]
MSLNAYQTYQQNSVGTASPGELTLMLYNGCLKFLNQAKAAIEKGKIEDKNTNLLKAQKIIQELMVTLNTDVPVGNQMMHLYDYMNRRLMEANVKNEIAIIEEVEGLTVEFRDTWKQVIQQNRKANYGAGGQA